MLIKRVNWSQLVSFATARSLSVQWIDYSDRYWCGVIDGNLTAETYLDKIADAVDVLDFETNYKAAGNRPLQPLDSAGQPIIGVKRIKPLYTFQDLKRTTVPIGSRAMNVSGTLGSPIHFEFKPTGSEVWEVESLRFALDDVGLTDMGLFGGLTVLTNGIQVSVSLGGVVTTIGTIKDNVDVVMMFPGQSMGQSGVLDTSDGLAGTWAMQDPIELKAANGDYIRMTVLDDLTLINILRATAVARKVP